MHMTPGLRTECTDPKGVADSDIKDLLVATEHLSDSDRNRQGGGVDDNGITVEGDEDVHCVTSDENDDNRSMVSADADADDGRQDKAKGVDVVDRGENDEAAVAEVVSRPVA